MRTFLSLVTMLTAAAAQSQPAATFDAASIRRNVSGDTRAGNDRDPEDLTIVNETLRDIIREAWGLHEVQVEGGPEWIRRDRFDILARTPRSVTPDEMNAMLRALLIERFGLAVHTERKDRPAYLLVRARSDGTLGRRIRLRPDCVDRKPGFDEQGSNPCGGVLFGPGRLAVRGKPLSEVGFAVDRLVIDRSGVTGPVDIDLEFMPERLPAEQLPELPAPPLDAPSIFTALQEQLGLRLEPASMPVDVLVIDRVEHPSPN